MSRIFPFFTKLKTNSREQIFQRIKQKREELSTTIKCHKDFLNKIHLDLEGYEVKTKVQRNRELVELNSMNGKGQVND